MKCKDCGKVISVNATRCKPCSNKNRRGNYYISNSYRALHYWIRNHKKKPKLCEACHKNKPYEVANISGKYKRDLNDFKWLCRGCHMLNDGRMKNLKQYSNICKCGFEFSGPGEFRNCEAFVTVDGMGGVLCPRCKRAYLDGKEIKLPKETDGK